MRANISASAKCALRIPPAVMGALLAGVILAYAQGLTVDRGASDALTRYLRANRLPLVAAQVFRQKDGSPEVVLYGFVATEFGKGDSENKARQYLHAPEAAVIDRIKVNPEIAHLKSPAGSGAPQGSPTPAPANEWEDVMRHIYQSGALTPPPSGVNAPPGMP